MSQKITAKNLQYNSNLPPFLARLRGQNASDRDSDAPDPILAARRRPGKKRSGSAEAEDAPLVVDEHGNAVDVTLGADGTVKEKEPTSTGAEAREQHAQPTNAVGDVAASAEKVASIGEQRKRKIGKVIGADANEADATEQDTKGHKPGKAKTGTTAEKDEPAPAAKAKGKKKAKKVKLSFGDDEG